MRSGTELGNGKSKVLQVYEVSPFLFLKMNPTDLSSPLLALRGRPTAETVTFVEKQIDSVLLPRDFVMKFRGVQ